MTSPIYIRTVAITRPAERPGVGFQADYSGDDKASETPVAAGLPASIQLVREGSATSVGLPGEVGQTIWNILMPKGALAPGQVLKDDIATDDLGNRFQVIGPYVNRLGANLRVKSLKP